MKKNLNLLPQKFVVRQLVKRRLKFWSVCWLAGALFLTLFGAWEWSQFNATATRAAELEEKLAPFEKMSAELETINAELVEVQSHEAIALQLAEDSYINSLLGIVSRAARESDGRLMIRRLVLQRAIDPENPAAADTLVIDGAGHDNQAVAVFASELRDSQVFQEVKLESAGSEAIGTNTVRSYTVKCAF